MIELCNVPLIPPEGRISQVITHFPDNESGDGLLLSKARSLRGNRVSSKTLE